ncbi:hypothetical protein H7H51_11545 [Mycolicibacterium farcinogenes]|nr:hypothetical protein [Mycolicibacterium farcinogenes]
MHPEVDATPTAVTMGGSLRCQYRRSCAVSASARSCSVSAGTPPPPPNLAWRGIDQGRFDHQPFNYNGHWVTPFFNPQFNNWGFWLFGIWIPL